MMKVIFFSLFSFSLFSFSYENELNIDKEFFLQYLTTPYFKFFLEQSQEQLEEEREEVELEEKEEEIINEKVFIIIPGHGCQEDRSKIILNNLFILYSSLSDNKHSNNKDNNNYKNKKHSNLQIDCLLFLSCEPNIYLKNQFKNYCHLSKYQHGTYSQYLKSISPFFLHEGQYNYLLVLLDDAQLSSNYHLPSLIQIIKEYSLSAISPSIINSIYPSSACPFCLPRLKSTIPLHLQTIIQPINKKSSFNIQFYSKGYLTDTIETFAVLFTYLGWKCFSSIIQPTINSIGWSYDRVYKKYCQERFKYHHHQNHMKSSLNHRQKISNFTLGIIDTMFVLHNSQRIQNNESDPGQPLTERNKWLKLMQMEQYLSTNEVFSDVII